MANAYDYCVVNYHSIDIIHLCNSFISSLFRYDANWLVWFIAFHMPKWYRIMHDAVSPFSLFAAHGRTWSSKHSIDIERQMQLNMSTSVTPIDIRPLKREYSNTDCVEYFEINANIERFGVVAYALRHGIISAYHNDLLVDDVGTPSLSSDASWALIISGIVHRYWFYSIICLMFRQIKSKRERRIRWRANTELIFAHGIDISYSDWSERCINQQFDEFNKMGNFTPNHKCANIQTRSNL